MAKSNSNRSTGALNGTVATPKNEYSNFSRIYRAEVALEMAQYFPIQV